MFSFRALDNEWGKIAKSCVLRDRAGPAHTQREREREREREEKQNNIKPPH
jgi:hypothetical protein